MRKIRDIVVAALPALMLLQSCIYDHNRAECTTGVGGGKDSESVLLSLLITSQSDGTLGTRAGGHDMEAALDPENDIDITEGGYRIMIFDGRGHFVQNFDVTSQRLSAVTEATYSIALTGPLDVNTGDIQVVVLTNWKKFDASDYPSLTADDLLSNLYTDDTKNIFTMPTVNAGGSHTSWQPQVSTSGIPMFGVSEVIPLSAAKAPTAGDTINGEVVKGRVLDMGEIKMLRALAKIEVMFTGNDSSLEGLTISGVALSAYNTTGRFIPDVTANPDWGVATTQVTTPTLPASVALSSHELNFASVSGGTMRAYVPEMALGTNRPTLTITVTDTVSGISQPFTINLDNPTNPGTLQHLLRNHIYRYKIERVDMNAEITAVLDVVPYDVTVLNPGFGKDNDEMEADGRPDEDKDLNPGFGE